MMGEFLLFKKNKDNKSYSLRGLKTLKELKRLSEDIHKFVKKTTYVNYYFKQFNNPQASKCTRKLTTLQVFYV